jgi:hypothetical protein
VQRITTSGLDSAVVSIFGTSSSEDWTLQSALAWCRFTSKADIDLVDAVVMQPLRQE